MIRSTSPSSRKVRERPNPQLTLSPAIGDAPVAVVRAVQLARLSSLCPAPRPLCKGVFLARVEALRLWLAARPEKAILLVSHWGVIEAITGDEFQNCEVRVCVFF